MPSDRRFSGVVLDGVSAIDRGAWAMLFPDEAEGWDYYAACEHGARPEMRLGAVAVYDACGLAAAAPLFLSSYRLDTPLQGVSRRLAEGLAACLPNLLSLRLLGIGSPYAEECHIGLRPGISADERMAAAAELVHTIEAHAVACQASLIAFKDMAPGRDGELACVLRAAGFTPIESLPVASLDLSHADFDTYMNGLSSATRKDLRRKLKKGGHVRIEHRKDLAGLEEPVTELYESTRRHSRVHYGGFEELPDGYFGVISRMTSGAAHFVLYWLGDQIIAFNLLLLQKDRVIDKLLGCAYPVAQEQNIYALSWVENVRFAIENGYPRLQSGQTAYALKLRYGSDLVPSTVYAKSRRPLLDWIIRKGAGYMAFTRWDPDLRRLAGQLQAPRPLEHSVL
jgi:hypothetical protein